MTESAKVVAELIDNLRRVFQAVNEQSKKVERETGLTGPQLWAIKVIAENAPIKVSELARRMYLHPATVVGILDRLEGHGLVMRTRSVEDRRVVEIDLTGKGKQLLEHSPEVAQGMLVKGLETLQEEKLYRISDGLKQLVEILGAREIAPKLMFSPEVNLPRTNGESINGENNRPMKPGLE
jgi:MarR family transcriptional regulator, organic hydroperoxide resistance regulator